MTIVHTLVVHSIIQWKIDQIDVKNTLINDDLHVEEYDSNHDSALFVWCTNVCGVLLSVYFYGRIVTGDDHSGIVFEA
ncbi:hypothetical protein LXL04_028076 [Taraxacum kok-saghyz]